MLVVTFSGVTSGGIVTSGTTCWTYIISMSPVHLSSLYCTPKTIPDASSIPTLGTKLSLIKLVMMEDFPTPSIRSAFSPLFVHSFRV
jgi:hypothetical protein